MDIDKAKTGPSPPREICPFRKLSMPGFVILISFSLATAERISAIRDGD